MRRLVPQDAWPESWRRSHDYDRLEIHGERPRCGYARAYAERRRHTLELVARAAPPPATLLDVAAAQGNFTLALAELGYQVTWNDLRGELAGFVRLKQTAGTVRFAPGNAFELGLRDAFDIVLITEVIEHVAHPDAFLRHAAALVRPGGHLVMTTPNGRYFRNRLPRFSNHPNPATFEDRQFQPDADGHIFLLHPDEIPPLAAAAGLDLLELRLFGCPLTHGALGTEPCLRFLPNSAIQTVERLVTHLPLLLRQRLCLSLAALLQRPGPGRDSV
ncbi:MAG: methyltransferase domain-containing protein [Verrucomicrobiae bacterium]|nr:methyltransferase domain-containing protein [Verrucomicrobiae bacterium]